ncbi:unnamed protein product [Allacma fusca]|uniref:Uncharacterized protein n=1 Tax=Allacma fusca TaxID=39272 RepID=A0A8J2JN41_9HEXA|nr:unnamed protein product [Allacma fusca]
MVMSGIPPNEIKRCPGYKEVACPGPARLNCQTNTECASRGGGICCLKECDVECRKIDILVYSYNGAFGQEAYRQNIILVSMAQHMVKRGLGEIECNGSSPVVSPLSEPTPVESTNFLRMFTICYGIYLFVSIFNCDAEKMGSQLRRMCLEALLRQNIGWYDTVQDRNFLSQISDGNSWTR